MTRVNDLFGKIPSMLLPCIFFRKTFFALTLTVRDTHSERRFELQDHFKAYGFSVQLICLFIFFGGGVVYYR